MQLYITRHGETEWNLQNKILGRTDIPLTEKGLDQARQLAQSLKDISLDKIYTSPLSRAVVTGAEVAKLQHNCPCEALDCLIELDYGIYEGLDRGDPAYQAEKRTYFKRYPGGGESFLDAVARVYPFLFWLRDHYRPDQRVLVVTHGGICRIITNYFQDMENEEFTNFTMGNCEWKVFSL